MVGLLESINFHLGYDTWAGEVASRITDRRFRLKGPREVQALRELSGTALLSKPEGLVAIVPVEIGRDDYSVKPEAFSHLTTYDELARQLAVDGFQLALSPQEWNTYRQIVGELDRAGYDIRSRPTVAIRSTPSSIATRAASVSEC